jgi:hypothetical protein
MVAKMVSQSLGIITAHVTSADWWKLFNKNVTNVFLCILAEKKILFSPWRRCRSSGFTEMCITTDTIFVFFSTESFGIPNKNQQKNAKNFT